MIYDGQDVNAAVVNPAFMSRIADTTTTGKIGLQNASSDTIVDAQSFINEIGDVVGIAAEGDANKNVYSSNNYVTNGDNRKVAIGKLDAATKAVDVDLQAYKTSNNATVSSQGTRIGVLESNNTQDVTLGTFGSTPNTKGLSLTGQSLILQPADGTNPGAITSGTQTIGGNKTFTGNMVIQGGLDVQGTTTTISSATLNVTDANVTVNNGGNDASAEGAGLDVVRTTANAGIRFDSSLASNFKIGLISALREVVVSGVAQVISGLKSFSSGIASDTVVEYTTNAGVTVGGVLLKTGLTSGRNVATDGATLDTLGTTVSGHTSTLSSYGGRITTLETNNSADVTLGTFGSTPNPKGASLSGQVLTLQPSDATNPGLLSVAAQTLAGVKTFQDGLENQAFTNWPQANLATTGTGVTLALLQGITRLTNAALVSVAGITAPSPAKSRLAVLTNITGNTVPLLDNNGGASAGNKILTGSGADLNLANNASAWFYYDSVSAIWRLIGISSTTAPSVNVNTMQFNANGLFNQQGALTATDGLKRAPFALKLTNAVALREIAGSSGSTTFDLQYKPPAGAWTSVFSTKPIITSAAGAEVSVGVGETVANATAGILTASPVLIPANSLLRMNLDTVETGSPNSATIEMIYEPQ